MILLGLLIFVAGFIAGLFYAAFQEPATQMAGDQGRPPQPAPAAPDQPTPEEMEHVQVELERLEAEIEANPGRPGPLVEAGNLLFDHGMMDRAAEYYKEALEIGGENPNVLTDLGVAYRRMGQPEKAVEYFRRAQKADPDHEVSALNLGIVLFHDLQDTQGALEAWRRYLGTNPQGERADMIRQVVQQLEREESGQ
jgi:tetratricopeptide (TPR) repeat protein